MSPIDRQDVIDDILSMDEEDILYLNENFLVEFENDRYTLSKKIVLNLEIFIAEYTKEEVGLLVDLVYSY